MRDERATAWAGAAALVALAAAVAFPFRAAALKELAVARISWDAALHTLLGLDLWDELRRLHVHHAVLTALDQHWWPPLYGAVLVPFMAVFGRSAATGSLPSLTAFLLAPAVAWLVVRRLAGRDLLASLGAFVLVALVFLRSPMLLETSAWAMLESLGGLIGLAAWLFFSKRSDPFALRAASVLGAALFFLKYHYGFFALVTFAAVLAVEESRETRAALFEEARTRLLRWPVLAAAAFLALAAAARLTSIPNVLYAALVLAVLTAVVRRTEVIHVVSLLSERGRAFLSWGLAPVFVWLLIPGNVRGWYRQLFQPHEAPVRLPLLQLGTFAAALRDEYLLGPVPLALLGAGFVLALCLSRERTMRAMALFVLWPTLLMSLSSYPVEARFLGCLVPSFFAVSIAGILAGLHRLPGAVRIGATAAVAAALGLSAWRKGNDWDRELAARASYRYPYPPAETSFIDAMAAAVPGTRPILVAMPPAPLVGPTLRLAVRLLHPALAPEEVVVEGLTFDKCRRELFSFGVPFDIVSGEEVDRELASILACAAVRDGPVIPGSELRMRVRTSCTPIPR